MSNRIQTLALVVLGVPLLLLVLPATVHADTIYVCWDGSGDYLTIQEGIDAARDGDEVVVCDGTYTGPGNKNLDFGGRTITVRSENGPANCIIDSQGDGQGFHFHTGETNESVADGFTITNGGNSSWGAGITCTNSSNPTITNCIISRNILDSGGVMMGAGICCVNSDPIVRNCTISENTIYVRGGHCHGCGAGVGCFDSNAVIVNCTITANIVDGTDASVPSSVLGGGIWASVSNLTITDCTIAANAVIGAEPVLGGGIYLYRADNTTITSSIITANAAYSPSGGYGGGIAEEQCGSTIANCIIAGNTADNRGAGIWGWKSSAAIANCTIAGNTAGRYGGGVYCDYYGNPTLTNCILWADTPEEIYVESGSPVVTYCDVQGGWPGEDNIDADPLFVDPNGEDFHLLPGSPCIDTGDPDFVAGPDERDIDGHMRVWDGDDDDECVVDMGSDEFASINPGDLDRNGCVDHADLGILLAHWGEGCP